MSTSGRPLRIPSSIKDVKRCAAQNIIQQWQTRWDEDRGSLRYKTIEKLEPVKSTFLVLSKLSYCNSVLVGLSKTLTICLQSVVNAAARLVMRKHKYDHITPILSELHWLGIERRIEFKVALLVFKCLKEMAPPYLASKVTRLRDFPSRKRLRSSSLSLLFVPAGRLKCAGDRSFTVAGPRIWNQLPPQVTSAATIESFRKSLNMHLYGGLEVLWFGLTPP